MNAIARGVYPSPPARNLFLVTNGKPVKTELVAFLRFILTEGQKYATETGYVPLSEEVVNEELLKLK